MRFRLAVHAWMQCAHVYLYWRPSSRCRPRENTDATRVAHSHSVSVIRVAPRRRSIRHTHNQLHDVELKYVSFSVLRSAQHRS